MRVNQHEQATQFGGGEDGQIHTLLLHDLHGEYTGDFDSRLPIDRDNNFGSYGECEIIWKTSAMQDAFQEIRGISAEHAERSAATMMRDFLPPQFLEREGDDAAYIEWVWRLTGAREYLEAKFTQLAETLTVDEVSGDDDAFDYWPNTMDMLWDFACDLDEITDTELHKARVWEVARKVFEGTLSKRQGNWGEQEYRDLFVGEWSLDHGGRGWNDWYQDVG